MCPAVFKFSLTKFRGKLDLGGPCRKLSRVVSTQAFRNYYLSLETVASLLTALDELGRGLLVGSDLSLLESLDRLGKAITPAWRQCL